MASACSRSVRCAAFPAALLQHCRLPPPKISRFRWPAALPKAKLARRCWLRARCGSGESGVCVRSARAGLAREISFEIGNRGPGRSACDGREWHPAPECRELRGRARTGARGRAERAQRAATREPGTGHGRTPRTPVSPLSRPVSRPRSSGARRARGETGRIDARRGARDATRSSARVARRPSRPARPSRVRRSIRGRTPRTRDESARTAESCSRVLPTSGPLLF